jgi:hypothetical protein
MDKGERGLWRGGTPPFGYRANGDTLTVVPAEAEIVRSAVDSLLSGVSIKAIISTGGPTTHQGWRKLLLSPTIAGITHTGHTATWPPLIHPDDAARVHSLLNDPSRRYHHGTARVHWLSGLVVCGRCDGPMRHQARTRNGVDYSRWCCADCRGLSIVAGPLEQFVEGAIFEAAPSVGESATSEPIPPKGDGVPLGGIESRLAEMTAMYVRGDITREMWEAAKEAAAGTTPSTPPPPKPTSTITEQAWSTWTPEERRRAAGWLLHRVIILPATVDFGNVLADRVEFEWVR